MSESVAVIPQTNGAVDFGGLMTLCEALVPTGFLPKAITTPGMAAAIILAGQELGMTPMLALRSITMVQGKVVVAADAQLALFKARGGRASFKELTDNAAILKLTHPNGDEHTEAFTMLDAKRAGLTNNPTWSKYPRAMLRSRVITAGLKSIGFEPTAGSYDPEEAQAFTVETVENPTPAQDQSAVGSAPATTASATPTTSPPTSSEREIDGEAVEDEITRETPYDGPGKLKGTSVMQMSDAALSWGIEPGRKLGPATESWQQVMRAELERRTAPAREDDAELSEKIGEPV